jgi:hypothetical protein
MATISNLRSRLQATLRLSAVRTDAFLVHLNKVLSTSSGVEAVLCTSAYTLIFTHSYLTRWLARRYERLALAYVSEASKTLLPDETIVAAIEPPASRLLTACACNPTVCKYLAQGSSTFPFAGVIDPAPGALEPCSRIGRPTQACLMHDHRARAASPLPPTQNPSTSR